MDGDGNTTDAVPAGEAVLGALLDESPYLRPDELPGAIRNQAARLGLTEATIYLADVRQVVLSPFPSSDGEPIDIDTTEAGRCYRDGTIVESQDGERLWFPLLNGTDRLGVLATRANAADAACRARGRQIAALTAELLIGKASYGDHILTTSRLKDLSLAAELRWSLIPPLTFTGRDFAIAGFLEPGYDIAGDTFDYAVNANTAHVGIFDAVGHGLEASRIANMALTSYRHSRRKGLALPPTYAAMDELVAESFNRSPFVTAQLATIDLPDGMLRWVNAGHPPPLLVRQGQEVQELNTAPSLPVGIGAGIAEVNELALEPGDVVALYSDGVTEARAPSDEEFGTKRLADLLSRAIAARQNPPETVRQILHAVVDHQEGHVVDDATLVIVQWRR